MREYEDEVSNSWPMKLFTAVLGGLILGYGIWCLYRGKAYTVGKLTGLHTYHGLAANLIAWPDISFAAIFFVVLIPFKNRKLFGYLVTGLLLLFFVLSGIGIFY